MRKLGALTAPPCFIVAYGNAVAFPVAVPKAAPSDIVHAAGGCSPWRRLNKLSPAMPAKPIMARGLARTRTENQRRRGTRRDRPGLYARRRRPRCHDRPKNHRNQRRRQQLRRRRPCRAGDRACATAPRAKKHMTSKKFKASCGESPTRRCRSVVPRNRGGPGRAQEPPRARASWRHVGGSKAAEACHGLPRPGTGPFQRRLSAFDGTLSAGARAVACVGPGPVKNAPTSGAKAYGVTHKRLLSRVRYGCKSAETRLFRLLAPLQEPGKSQRWKKVFKNVKTFSKPCIERSPLSA